IIGAPREGLAQVLGWLVDVVTRPAESAAAREQLCSWAAALLADRSSGAVRTDVVQCLLTASINGRPLTLDEQANILGLMILGAIDNTTNTLGSIAHLLATRPLLADLLRTDPRLVEPAIEEVLRLEP